LLDELDYGVVVVHRDLTVAHANRAAQHRLRLYPVGPLGASNEEWRLQTAWPRALGPAVQAAMNQGLRKAVKFCVGDDAFVGAVVPLPSFEPAPKERALLLLERARLCTPLSLAGYGRLHGLTGCEINVLAALAAGHDPGSVATELGVSIATVRTHVTAIRTKLGRKSVRETLVALSCIPPIVDVLKNDHC
jgi:DNA-binding CsgD family transcriptional regulator